MVGNFARMRSWMLHLLFQLISGFSFSIVQYNTCAIDIYLKMSRNCMLVLQMLVLVLVLYCTSTCNTRVPENPNIWSSCQWAFLVDSYSWVETAMLKNAAPRIFYPECNRKNQRLSLRDICMSAAFAGGYSTLDHIVIHIQVQTIGGIVHTPGI